MSDERFEVLWAVALDPGLGLSRHEICLLIAKVVTTLGFQDQPFTLRLVGDAEMAGLNKAHLGCTGPTNVLSFPEEDDPRAAQEPRLGEIALSIHTLLRESSLYGQPVGEHFSRLLAHGLLHLAGHDHGAFMEALTEGAVDGAAESLASCMPSRF